jgi:hypothetical protein
MGTGPGPLAFLAIVETAQGDMDAARAHAEEAIPMQRRIGDRQGLGTALGAAQASAARHCDRLTSR